MIDLGFVVTKIHKVYRFIQKSYLKQFALYIIQKRREYELLMVRASLMKFAGNSLYGSMAENEQNFVNSFLVFNVKSYSKMLNKDKIKLREQFGKTMFVQTYKQNVITRHLPSATTISSEGKVIVTYHWYLLVKTFGIERISLIQMDTDSLIVRLIGINLKEEIAKALRLERAGKRNSGIQHIFNLSTFNKTDACYDDRRHMCPETLKFELGNNLLAKLFGLVSKTFMYEVWKWYAKTSSWIEDKSKMVAKGMPVEREKCYTLQFIEQIANNKNGVMGQGLCYRTIDNVGIDLYTREHFKEFTNCSNFRRFTFAINPDRKRLAQRLVFSLNLQDITSEKFEKLCSIYDTDSRAQGHWRNSEDGLLSLEQMKEMWKAKSEIERNNRIHY